MDIAKIRKKRKEKEKEKKKRAKKEKDASPVETDVTENDTPSGIPEPSGRPAEMESGKDIDITGEHPETDTEAAAETPESDFTAERFDGAEEETARGKLMEFLVFLLSGEYYAFRLSNLQEVLKKQIITLVPKMPVFIAGITSLRGKIIPVMDLSVRLSIKEKTEESGKSQILIIKGPKGPMGMMVDYVDGVRRIEESNIKEPPSHLDEDQAKFIDSVVRDDMKFISILNVQEVLDFQPSSPVRRT